MWQPPKIGQRWFYDYKNKNELLVEITRAPHISQYCDGKILRSDNSNRIRNINLWGISCNFDNRNKDWHILPGQEAPEEV